MNLLKYTMILCFIVVFADISKAGPLLHGASNFIVTGVVPCPDDDEDEFFMQNVVDLIVMIPMN